MDEKDAIREEEECEFCGFFTCKLDPIKHAQKEGKLCWICEKTAIQAFSNPEHFIDLHILKAMNFIANHLFEKIRILQKYAEKNDEYSCLGG